MAPSDPMITPAPELQLRQAPRDANFMGWAIASEYSNYTSITCDTGASFYYGATYVGCVDNFDTIIYLATACIGGMLTYSPTLMGTRNGPAVTSACTNMYGPGSIFCNTLSYFQSFGAASPKTEYMCDTVATVYSVYHDLPTILVSSTVPASSSNHTVSSDPSPTGGDDGGGGDTSTTPSKAWIAGAVIGPIVGLALIGAIVYLLLRRRKNNRTVTGQTGSAYMGNIPPNGVGGDMEAKPYPYTKPELYSQPDFQTDDTLRNSQYTYRDSNFIHNETPELSVIASPTVDAPQQTQLPTPQTSTPPTRSVSPLPYISSSLPRTSSPLAQNSLSGPQNSPSAFHPSSPALPPIHTSPFQPPVLPETNHAQFDNPKTATSQPASK